MRPGVAAVVLWSIGVLLSVLGIVFLLFREPRIGISYLAGAVLCFALWFAVRYVGRTSRRP